MRFIYLFLIIFFVLLSAGLTMGNLNEVDFNYIVGNLALPLIWVIIISFAIGAILSMSIFLFVLFKQQRQIKRLEHSKKLVQKELDNLRQLRSDLFE